MKYLIGLIATLIVMLIMIVLFTKVIMIDSYGTHFFTGWVSAMAYYIAIVYYKDKHD